MDHVALLSLEPWDEVWRRNQHLASRLVSQGHVRHLTFVEPAVPGRGRRHAPQPGITAIRPTAVVPNRVGGVRAVAAALRRHVMDADVLWVNAPELGAALTRAGQRAVYDVTDDWRTYPFPPRIRERITRAEDALAREAATVVCSEVLAQRWQERYGVTPPVVPNGHAVAPTGRRIGLPGDGPHLGYVGTIQAERLDLSLVRAISEAGEATLHLVGPTSLGADDEAMLRALPRVHLHGRVASSEVPVWLHSFDALVCPHVVDDFTLSLDAIKAHEYLATGLPVVATPTSGFQHLDRPQLRVVGAGDFVAALQQLPARAAASAEGSWDQRTLEFAAQLRGAA